MIRIVATEALSRELESAEGSGEFVDAEGKPLVKLTRPPSDQDIRIAKERLSKQSKKHTTANVLAYLKRLQGIKDISNLNMSS